MKTNLGVNQVQEDSSVAFAQTRAASRIRIQIPVFLKGADAQGVEFIELTKTLNISAKGACITSSHLLRPNQTVQLTIPSPTTPSSSMVPSETPPIVARVRRQGVLGELRVFGLEFLRSLE